MTSLLTTLKQSFSPLRNRNFSIYLGGQAISLIGTWAQSTAQGWVVWELTRSEAVSGQVQMLAALPILLIGLWTGVWADRLDRRKLLIGTQVAAMLFAFILAYLVLSHQVQIGHIFLLALGLGVVTAIDMPAQQVFLGDLTGMGEMRKAVNLNAMILQVSRVLGPAIAGLIIAKWGAGNAFIINGLSFLAVIVSLWVVRSSQKPNTTPRRNPFIEMGEALRFVGQHPRLQDLFIFAGLVVFLVLSIILSQLPAFADHVLGGDAQTYSILVSMSGLGALVGVVFITPWAQAQKRSGLLLGAASVWLGLSLWLFALSRSLPIASLSLFFTSLVIPNIMTTCLGLTQYLSPPDMRARLMTLFTMITFGLQPFALLLVGTLAEHYGVTTVIQINGALLIIGALLLFFARPALRTWQPNAPQTTASVSH